MQRHSIWFRLYAAGWYAFKYEGREIDRAEAEERQRALIAHAVEIYRWRGTRRGLRLHITAYTGVEPVIQEYNEGFTLGRDNVLGYTTHLVSVDRNPLLFVVTVPVPDPDAVDVQVLHTIVEEDKPAHTVYRLHVVRCQATGAAAPLSPAACRLSPELPVVERPVAATLPKLELHTFWPGPCGRRWTRTTFSIFSGSVSI